MAPRLLQPDAYTHMWESEMQRLASPMGNGVEVALEAEGVEEPQISPTGAITIPMEDGGVVIQFPGASQKAEDEEDEFERNLALEIDDSELGRIADDLITAIQSDDDARKEWLNTRAKGIDLLALKIDPPRSDAGGSAAPLEGMSSVRNPLLLEAVLRFQANARGELLPSAGPVKVKNSGLQTFETDAQADALERDMNAYLTVGAPEYYPDTDRLLLFVGFGGCGFKKVYHCPIRKRPVSESVDAKDLIVPSSATDLRNSPRITHQITMHPDLMRLMQLEGVYRDVSLSQPTPTPDAVTSKINQVQGTQPSASRPQDQPYTLYECYCNLDIPGFEHEKDGDATGYRLPYRVTLDKDSKEILEIRRNWSEEDKGDYPQAKRVFVKYSFVPGLGFYDIGLLHILGNASQALTAAWRLALDNGMFSNFPGFVYSKQAVGRQISNEFRVPPGGGVGLDIGNIPIGQAVMGLPYKGLGGDFQNFMNVVQQTMQRVGGTAETSVGEGKQDAPVGTTLALIEQATKIMDAVHKRLHAAQAEEFQLLRDRFREDPEAFFRNNEGMQYSWDSKTLLDALKNYKLEPQADPNTPSSMHRMAKVAALLQLNTAFPGRLPEDVVLKKALHALKMDDLVASIKPPSADVAPPDPKLIATQQKTMIDQAKLQQEYIKMQHDAEQSEKDRRSKEDLAILQLANTQVIHPYSAGLASNPAIPRQIMRPQQ